jgi:UDP-N-acetylglucosamine pyrophosphorylase
MTTPTATDVLSLIAARPDWSSALATLRSSGLDGCLERYLSDAGERELAIFFADLARCDLEHVCRHRHELLSKRHAEMLRLSDLAAPEAGRLDGPSSAELLAAGRASLASGQWAAVVFAGGSGTRFFIEARNGALAAALPEGSGATIAKGLFPLTPVERLSFLDLFAAETLASGIASGCLPPLVVMTSSQTDTAIRAWLASAELWGFPARTEQIRLLRQAEHPRLDDDGQLVVEPSGALVFTGDGHGGVFRALLAPIAEHGGDSLADRLRAAGVRSLVLHNVDNAASHPFAPARLGYHRTTGGAFTLSFVPRTDAAEKVGVAAVLRSRNRLEVVEYSVCPPEVFSATRPDGGLLYDLAHINVNLVELGAIRADLPPTLYTGKKIVIGAREVSTSSYEMLNQHLAALLEPERVGVLLLDRNGYFQPTKSVYGSDSSLETTVAAMIAQAADRLRALGATVDPGAIVEIHPCLTGDDDALTTSGAAAGWRLDEASRTSLGVRHGIDGRPPFGDGLVVERGATVRLQADRPYGRVAFEPTTRAVRAKPAVAGRLHLGDNVTIAAGAQLSIRIAGDGVAIIPNGTKLTGRHEVVVEPGSVWKP